MLSTDSGGTSAPAPTLLPSDRPPDIPSDLAIAESKLLSLSVAPNTSSIDMAIDSSALTMQERPVQVPVAGPQTGLGTGQPLSYAKAVMGAPAKASTLNQVQRWTR
ncbi:unnamed protein product [Linum trigynum]|uniref:Uncharacterized protein n=1 Tax=Linum trigynum TaxID=586398 RepID=A0AAV2G9J0_9ROSI